MKKPIIWITLLFVMLCLCGCGKKETASGSAIVNWTLPDVAAFEESYAGAQAELETAQEGQQEPPAYRWNPHGVFTYVTGVDGRYSTALFKVISVDYENHCAVVTYTVKDSRGYEQAKETNRDAKEENFFFESNGERVTGLEEKTDADGTRHIIIYLSNDHYLEFSGKDRMENAKYCYKNLTYRLKYEG